MKTSFVLSADVVSKVLETVDAGLSSGLGVNKPGSMCVEAAVCYALGLPHGDDPQCVDGAIRALKIQLNDSQWSSREARARGLRKLAVLQLGTKGVFDTVSFAQKVAALSSVYAKQAKQYAANAADNAADNAAKYADNAAKYAANAAYAARYAAYAAKYAAYAAANAAYAAKYAAAAARDKVLSNFAEDVAQILIEMNVPAVKYLSLLK